VLTDGGFFISWFGATLRVAPEMELFFFLGLPLQSFFFLVLQLVLVLLFQLILCLFSSFVAHDYAPYGFNTKNAATHLRTERRSFSEKEP
jgi:membrane protein required for beta-lactamase induction